MSARRAAGRRGFSLLELSVVLVLIVAIAAVSWPPVRGGWRRASLRESARQVRGTLARARLEALESGQPCAVRYEPGGRRLQIGPVEPEAAAGEPLPDAAKDDEDAAEVVELAADVALQLGGEEEKRRDDALAREPPAGDKPRWSPAAVFEPDGRARAATIELSDGDRMIAVELNGLSGRATIGPVQRVEEPHATVP